MASSNSSSCSPSSSAVTIPVPGKSILKKSTAAPQSLFSRITRFLPNQPTQPNDEKPLKRAHFILPQIAVVYPISSLNPPSTAAGKDEKRAIEDREAERRRRVVRGNSLNSVLSGDTDDWWSFDKVESFYRECCTSCDEQPDPAISAAFKHANPAKPKTVDFSGVQLTATSASILADVFTIEWGLRKLIFRECNLDEHILKPILHALLIPGTLSFLSLASNRRLKAPAFRYVGAFAAQAKDLEFLDLSQNNLDKKSVEYIVAALATAPAPGLLSLRVDDCSVRHAALDVLARAVRTSSLRNISLRHNRINQSGAVALALMIRDYPDVVPAGTPLNTPTGAASPYPFSSPLPSASSSPLSSSASLPPFDPSSAPTSPTSSNSDHVTQLHGASGRPLLPPPRHPPTAPQTTYTPYIPRSRRGRPATLQQTRVAGNPLAANPLSPTGQPIPIITSSSQGGVTTRHPVGTPGVGASASNGTDQRHSQGPSAALLDKVRALDALPRLGALRTLDLKGNDLRTGVAYLAQVLKRNRTLKVLNLSENKLDVQCLVYIAEALKYNSCLETLDLSKNPCSGPGLEGIQSLRTAFTLNTALKRLFLSSTSLTSSGAIALAEFLPEATALLHLDLTDNTLDIASVMALRSGLKANLTMRCLDLNIPPGDEEFARMCRDILNYCVRNTEEAERNASAKDLAQQVVGEATANGTPGMLYKTSRKGVWGLIDDSELARSIRQEDAKTDGNVVTRTRACISQLQTALGVPSPPGHTSNQASPDATFNLQPPPSREGLAEVVRKARELSEELKVLIQATDDPGHIEELLAVNDELHALVSRAPVTPVARPALTLQGLGFKWNAGSSGSPSVASPTQSPVSGTLIGNGTHSVNGEESVHMLHDSPVENEEEVTTPRIDKGKAKARPEPEALEKVLSPVTAFSLTESESEDEDGRHYAEEGEGENSEAPSPMNRSRSWVEEEGEVFRKGAVLLGPDEMEGEYAGEELRRELLDAMVERPPPRPLVDEYGMEMIPSPVVPDASSGDATTPLASPTVESKSSPRPYHTRRTSSSSILSVITPTLGLASPTTNPDTVTSSTPSLTPGLRSPTMLSPSLPSLAASRPYAARSRSSSNTDTP